MLQLTYTESDSEIAEQMRQDLSEAHIRLQHRILIVLISPESVADSSVIGSIHKAINEKQLIAPVILKAASLPESLNGLMTLDLQKGYKKDKLIQFVDRVDIGQERLGRNRRWAFYVSVVILLVFIVSISTLSTGIIAPPLDEFATEKALEDAQVETVIAPQLEMVQPHTTQDAENFPSTLEAVSEQLRPFVIATATALPNEFATDMAYETVIAVTLTAETQTSGN